MRLFAAVWPPDEVLDHLDLALAAVRGASAGADWRPIRWSARETWHLTLAFYGTVPEGDVPALVEGLVLAAHAAEPYELRLRGAGVFAHRTLWAGVAGDLGAHRALTRACGQAGEAVGTPPDLRVRERPHVTIGRAAPGGGPVRRPQTLRGGRADRVGASGSDVADALVSALAVYEGPPWTVASLALVESVPGAGRGGGPLYTRVEQLSIGV